MKRIGSLVYNMSVSQWVSLSGFCSAVSIDVHSTIMELHAYSGFLLRAVLVRILSMYSGVYRRLSVQYIRVLVGFIVGL